ncbi:hypothetical protein C8R44DRAFT_892596 [Mycena epipterygia]|nr:hypothetical protein C8R44DRAFT_892596 [Mycena epipterygia]
MGDSEAINPSQTLIPQRHPNLYFPDGTLTLKTQDGTVYNVYRQQLIIKSDFFGGMLTLPIPEHTSSPLSENSMVWLERAKKAGLDGTSDATAVEMPDEISTAEFDEFLEFILNILPWTDETPELARLCAILKTCDFFGVESGMQYAIHHLEDHPELGPALRYKLASDFGIQRWAKRAFYELMSESILEISEVDEIHLGWAAYRALVRTHAEVARHRLTLALFPPDAVHANFCYDNEYCGSRWAENWVGMSGGLGTLLKDELSGAEMHDALVEMKVPGMTGECRLLTITSIQDTAAAKSLLRKEDDYVDKAVAALIRDW